MPFIAPIVGAIGAAASALGITASTLVSLALSVGFSLVQMLLNRPPKPEDIQSVVRQSVPIRAVHLGRVRCGGPLVFVETTNRTIYVVIYFCQGPADGFEEWFIDSRTAEVDANGWVTSSPYGNKGGKRVKILTRTGAETSTVYDELQDAFPKVVTKRWRGDGLATALLIAKSVGPAYVAKHYPNRIPALNVVGRFGKPYNPLKGTREWTESLPLHLLEYLTSPEGLGLDEDLIDMADFARAHKIASEIVQTKGGGTVRRYWGSTTWRLDEQPKDIINRTLLAMDGRLFLRPNGKIGLLVGEWIKPTVHIPDNVIIDCELRDASPPIQQANEIVVKYTNPNANWTATTAQPWRNAKALEKAGGTVKNTTVELYGIQNHNHARRVAKILDQKLNPRWQGTIRTTLWGLKAWDQRFITLSYDDLRIDEEAFEVTAISLDEEDMTVTIQVVSVDSDLYDFDPEKEEGTAPVNPDTLERDAVPTPSGFKAETTSEYVNGRWEITLEMSCDVPRRNKNKTDDDDDDDVEYEFQYAVADSGRWRSLGTRETNSVDVDGLKDGKFYDARVRFRTSDDVPGEWAMIENIAAIGDRTPPGVPVKVSAKATSKSRVVVTCTAPKSENVETIELYRDDDPTARGSRFIKSVKVEPGAVVEIADTAAIKEERFYFVRAVNGSGVGSARVATKNNPVKIVK